ncbi:MAG: tape measure protein [Candidatus Thiodiazotropha taylori]
MADRNQISLRIKTIVEGLKDIDKLISEIDQLGGQAGETGKEAQSLNAEFKKLQKQQNAINQFEQLNSKISKTAKDLEIARSKATALGRAMATAEKPTKALANEFERARTRVQRLKEIQAAQTATLGKYTNKMKAAGVDTKRLTAEQVRLAGAMSKIKSKVSGVAADLNKTRNSYRAAAKEAKSYGNAVSSAGKLSETFGRLLPVAALAGVVKWFKDAAVGTQTLQKGFEIVSGSADEAAQEMDYLRRVSSQLGLPLKEAGEAYLSLAAAAKGTSLEGQASRDIFEAVSLAMGKLGRTSAQTEGALLAIQQMISKGKVSAEELRGQLGERLPGAFQAAARAMGVTTAELDKMLQNGDIVAEDLLPKLAKELNKLYDDGKKIETFGAGWNRLKNSVSGAFAAFSESTGVLGLITTAMEGLGSAVTLVSVGFTTVVEKLGAVGVAWSNFISLIKDPSLENYRTSVLNTVDAFKQADNAIAKAADTAFNADTNLGNLGETVGDTGDKSAKAGNDIKGLKGDLEAASDGAETMAESFEKVGLNIDQYITGLDQKATQQINQLATAMSNPALEGRPLLRFLQDLATKADNPRVVAEAIRLLGMAMEDGRLSYEESGKAIEALKQSLDRLEGGLDGVTEKTADATTSMYDLAASYREGKISAEEFYEQLNKLSEAQKRQKDTVSQTVSGYGKASGAASGYGQAVQNSEQQAAAARAKGLSGFANFWKRVYDTYHGISAAAGAAYDSLFEKFKRMGTAAKDYHYVLKTTHDFLEKLDVRIKDWAKGAQGYGESLRGVIANATRAIGNMKVLDAQKLNQLRSQIGAARAALRALNDEARDTLSSLRQELASLQGDVLGAEQLRYQQQREDLEAKLADARRNGASEAVAYYSQALSTLSAIHAQRMANIREEQAAAGNSTTASAQPLPPQRNNWGEGLTNNLVEVRFSNGQGLGTSGVFPEEGVGDFLQILQDAGATTE